MPRGRRGRRAASIPVENSLGLKSRAVPERTGRLAQEGLRPITGTFARFGGNIVKVEGGDRSDRELVAAFRGGDREAYLAVYRAHSGAVFRFVFHLCGDRGRAEEVTQDVFVWLIHHAGEWDAERGGLGAFLGGVARKFLHRRERSERRWAPLEEAASECAAAGMELEREQQAAALRRAIALLPAGYREAVVLCDLEGRSYEETAAMLGCAVGTVRSRLHRARGLLARKFQGKREGLRCT